MLLQDAWKNWLGGGNPFGESEQGTTKFSSFEAAQAANKGAELAEVRSQVRLAIERGTTTLKELLEIQPPATWPALWCDKTLYCPYGLLSELVQAWLNHLDQARKEIIKAEKVEQTALVSNIMPGWVCSSQKLHYQTECGPQFI